MNQDPFPKPVIPALLFLCSGAAALVYEVVWVRELGLVFGGSQLAVATVLSVFMGGLALGGFVLGRQVERVRRPLRLYGLLELGIAASALGVGLVLRMYPVIFTPLARLAEDSAGWLTLLRVIFAAGALLVPATLMGGTLPVLTRCLVTGPGLAGQRLALLYGLNTLGAVGGTLGAAFVLLPALGVARTTWVAVAVNLAIGLVALALRERLPTTGRTAGAVPASGVAADDVPRLAARLVLWGIGASGFCALGYEVLWTRVLSLVVGTSVYGFAVMLAAFLCGIALGSHALALLPRAARGISPGWGGPVLAFGLVQGAVAVTALLTTHRLRTLPLDAMRLQDSLLVVGGEFAARQATSFVLAFGWMALPALFMGLAFPIACALETRRPGGVGRAVGRVLAANTVGGILGAATSGFLLLPVFGIERSLQMLVVVNLGCGLAALAALAPPRRAAGLVALAGLGGAMLVGFVVAPGRLRTWDRDLFAVFRNNQRAAFDSPERVREALEHTEVLYYHEGRDETISVIHPRGGVQALLVNGRVEASTRREDVQCQRTLGHLPMLLHPDPRRVFVLGLGTGMTLGAASIHPEVERIVLAEIERGVEPAARAFGAYNHHVLEDPRLRIVHDDGRNFLRTTRETFDVITADPIHPGSRGAAYLYTIESLRSAAERLAPGGVVCQWLPIYELTPHDLRSITRTFASSFRHTALWLTHYDAELVGSQEPLVLDEQRLARRLAAPALAADLAVVDMGTPRDLLSHFVLGDLGVRAFAAGGVIHTDDNLWLEFSAPRAQGRLELPGENVEALAAFRESPLAYMVELVDPAAAAERSAHWSRAGAAARLYDRAHALALSNRWDSAEFAALVARLRDEFADYAPGRFLEERWREVASGVPQPVGSVRLLVSGADGAAAPLELTAVILRVGQGRGVVTLVDNRAREVWIERYVDAPAELLDARLSALAHRLLDALRAEQADAARGHPAPRQELIPRLAQVADAEPASE